MKFIHGLWHDEELPEKQFVDSWREKNPDAIVKVWTFAEAEKLIRKQHPGLSGVYDSMPFLLQRANILRVAILATYGGIYLDLDMECLRPFYACFNADLVLGNTRQFCVPAVVCNAIMGSKKREHHLWLHLLSVMQRYPKIKRDTEAVKTTGSFLLTKAVSELKLDHHVRPQPVFFPALRTPYGNAYTRHHTGRPEWVGKQFIDGELHSDRSELLCK